MEVLNRLSLPGTNPVPVPGLGCGGLTAITFRFKGLDPKP